MPPTDTCHRPGRVNAAPGYLASMAEGAPRAVALVRLGKTDLVPIPAPCLSSHC